MATLLELAQLSATSYGDPVDPPLNVVKVWSKGSVKGVSSASHLISSRHATTPAH